jgi:hypothetical protein
MPWVRIDENAMDHPKIGGLSDGAFRLWVQGLAYCQKYLTDGYISDIALRGLRAYSPKRRQILIAAVLWNESETGIRVHDFLEWNESREHVMLARRLAKDRLKKHREKRVANAVTNAFATAHVPSGVVCSEDLGSELTERGSGKTTLSERAGAFCQWYEDAYERFLGVGYIGTRNDYEAALRLCEKLSDQEVRDAAVVWFGMEDAFAATGTRTIPKFASRASGCLQQARARGIA